MRRTSSLQPCGVTVGENIIQPISNLLVSAHYLPFAVILFSQGFLILILVHACSFPHEYYSGPNFGFQLRTSYVLKYGFGCTN